MRWPKIFLIALLMVSGCKKKDPPNLPEAALLIFPNKNSECTVGNEVNATTREVDFRWQQANHTDTYELRVTNIGANTTQTISTPAFSARLPLQKGATFSWVVISKNSMVPDRVSSSTWSFYHAGPETTRPPFPAELISPAIGSSVFGDINNEVELQWSGSDLDDDIEGFEIYFDIVSPPVALLGEVDATVQTQKASVEADTVYYWKVVTKDAEGNTADSGIFDFRVY